MTRLPYRAALLRAGGGILLLLYSITLLWAPGAPAFDLGDLFDPLKAPFIPVPEIDISPDAGETLGVIATVLETNDQGEITRIVAPDLLYNSYFGWGARGRIYDYPSDDEQWSVVAGGKERVEREFDGEYVVGRTREGNWTFNLSTIYDRSGTPRFWGQGNNTPESADTNYTETQGLIQAQLGWNITHYLQLAWMSRPHLVDVTEGTLTGLVPITRRYAGLLGLGTNDEFLNRLLLILDTRNDLTVPSSGAEVVIYGGTSSRRGIFNDSLYSEAGIDARDFIPLTSRTVLALHSALRYLPSYHKLPFWAYSFIGGDQSVIGGEQPLRAYGEGRWSDPNSYSISAEVRQIVGSFNAVSTRIDLELAPFVDLGRVFLRPSTNPFIHLHDAYGLGVRGIARPFIVGYVDVGYGSEGIGAFTGINYEF